MLLLFTLAPITGSLSGTLGSLTSTSASAVAIDGSVSATLGSLTLNTVPAIVYQTPATVASGTTSVALPYPASIAAEELLVAAIVSKYPPNSPTTPAGWTLPANGQASGGSGVAGVDTGTVYVTLFVKEADGTETGNLTVSIASGNAALGQIYRLTKALTHNWAYAAANAANNTAGSAWSVTAGSDPDIAANDLVFVVSGSNTDAYTHTLETITASGVTFGAMSERRDSGTSTGQDLGIITTTHPVVAGASTAAPAYTMTASGTATDNPAGATVFLRLRQVSKTFNEGSLSATLGTATLSASGALAITGTLTATLGALTGASVGSIAVNATLSATLGALVGTASVQSDIAGALTATLNPLQVSSVAVVDLFASLTQTLGALSLGSAILISPSPSRARTAQRGGIQRTALPAISRHTNVRRPRDR